MYTHHLCGKETGLNEALTNSFRLWMEWAASGSAAHRFLYWKGEFRPGMRFFRQLFTIRPFENGAVNNSSCYGVLWRGFRGTYDCFLPLVFHFWTSTTGSRAFYNYKAAWLVHQEQCFSVHIVAVHNPLLWVLIWKCFLWWKAFSAKESFDKVMGDHKQRCKLVENIGNVHIFHWPGLSGGSVI